MNYKYYEKNLYEFLKVDGRNIMNAWQGRLNCFINREINKNLKNATGQSENQSTYSNY
jgi:hypothetical protein